MSKQLSFTNGDVQDAPPTDERCHGCNGPIRRTYDYCPWCGVELNTDT